MSTRQMHHLLKLILFLTPLVVLGTVNGTQVRGTGIQDPHGDVNMDSISYTIADAIYFVEYLKGCIELTDPVYQDTASDVNLNTIPWEVADLVIIIRVLNGFQEPPQSPPDTTELDTVWVSMEEDSNQVRIATNSSVALGGAYFVLTYEPGELTVGDPTPTGRSGQMDLGYCLADGELRIVLSSWENRCVLPGSGPLVNIPVTGTGRLTLQKADLCGAEGNLLKIKILPSGINTYESSPAIPKGFSLFQNYPNPFNPITEIKYALPKDCYIQLDVYNILGQKVASLVDGEQKAGHKSVRWDATTMSSGIYFCRLEVIGDRLKVTKTKKMILLK